MNEIKITLNNYFLEREIFSTDRQIFFKSEFHSPGLEIGDNKDKL